MRKFAPQGVCLVIAARPVGIDLRAARPRTIFFRGPTKKCQAVAVGSAFAARVRPERRAAIAAKSRLHGPLAKHGAAGNRVVEAPEQRGNGRAFTGFDGERALPDRWNKSARVQALRYAVPEAESSEPGLRENDGVEVAVVDATQTRVDVSAKRLDAQIWTNSKDLVRPA